MNNGKRFSDWDTYYRENPVEQMPWYCAELDSDLKDEIQSRSLSSGTFLDLGTGPGTQAACLADMGFKVTATDISQNAITKAQKLTNKVIFLTDDFLHSSLEDNSFDFVFDRGCFHTVDVSKRPEYVKQIRRILKNRGIIFLKCMSDKEKDLPEDEGPHRLSKKDIMDLFGGNFAIDDIRESTFQGTLNIRPKALFAVIKKV